SFTWTSRSGGITTAADHEIVAGPDGTSRVTHRIRQSGALAGVVALLVGRRARRYVDMEAAGLKRATEAATTGRARPSLGRGPGLGLRRGLGTRLGAGGDAAQRGERGRRLLAGRQGGQQVGGDVGDLVDRTLEGLLGLGRGLLHAAHLAHVLARRRL